MTRLLTYWLLLCACVIAQPELTNTEATNIDNATERQAWREALELWTDDSPTFLDGTYTGDLSIGGTLTVGNGALDDTHIVNIVSAEDVITEVMLHLEWNSPTPAAGDSNALLFSMYDSALNETEYARFRSVIEDPTDGTEDGAMTIDVLNDGVLEQAVLFSHDEIIMNDNGADRNFIVKDDDTNEVFRITGGNGSIAMDGSTLFVDSANNRVGVGTNTPSTALDIAGITTLTNGVESTTIETDAAGDLNIEPSGDEVAYFTSPAKNVYFNLGQSNTGRSWFRIGQNGTGSSQLLLYDGAVAGVKMAGNEDSYINGGNFGIGNTTPAAQLDVSGDTILSGDLTVDTNTLHVDSANNRVGVGTNTPSAGYALDVSGNTKITGYLDLDRTVDIYLGEIPSAPAYSGLWFSKNSSTATASNYSFLGDASNTFLNGPTTLYLRTGNTTRATIDADGIEVAAGDSISFTSNSGSWDGAALKVDTIDETAGNYDPLLDLSTGYLGRYGPHQINFKSGTLDTYNGITMQPVFDYGNVTLYDYAGTQILDLWSGLTFSGTPTLAGDFSVSGQLEATGQSPNTDNSVMTRSLVDDWSLDNIGRIFNLTLADLTLASSGTGAGATSSPNGVRLYSGTSTSGYARATLMSGTGGWAYSTPFQRPMAAAFAITFSPASVTDTGSGIRIGFGISTTAPWDSDGLTGAGFGFEYEPDGTNHRIRAIAHNGTTFTSGSWVNIGTGGIYAGHRGLLIESDGAGNISVTITAAYGDTSTTYTATTTGGPTTQASGTQSGLIAIACNESTGTPALIGCDIKAARVRLD